MKLALMLILLVSSGLPLGTPLRGDRPPPPVAVVEAVAPLYPVMALNARVTGTVSVDVDIRPDGTVTDVTVVDGPRLLHDIAKLTARRWRFESTPDPAPPRKARLQFTFDIGPDGTPEPDRTARFLPPYGVAIKSEPLHLVDTPSH